MKIYQRKDTSAIERHYRKYAHIYDFSRRFFLFGRKGLCEQLHRHCTDINSILEVGCGTAVNLLLLREFFPKAKITGLDLSKEMLAVAQKKIHPDHDILLIRGLYERPLSVPNVDLILFSYCLSTIEDLPAAIDLAADTLNPSGKLAIVDFHSSGSRLFKRWISRSIPIRERFPMELLTRQFEARFLEVHAAYCGVWRYFMYVGEKNQAVS